MINNSKKSQIRTLLFVFSSAILFGAIAAIFMVNHYDHGTPYSIKNILLSSKTEERFSSDSPTVEYSKWSIQSHQWEKVPIDLETYAKFYNSLEKDESIVPPDTLLEAFLRANPPTLTLFLQDKEFQRIQFAAQNYYRVELRMETVTGATGWAYFYHPAIEKKAEDLFISKGPSQ